MKLFTIDLGERPPFRYHIAIAGFRGCSMGNNMRGLPDRVRALEDGRTVLASQVFDAERIATHIHPLVSAIYALQAFKESRGISRTLGTETLLYSSAQHQIVEAIEMLGIRPKSSNIAAVVISLQLDNGVASTKRIGEISGGVSDDTILNIRKLEKLETIKRVFKVSALEMESAEIGTTQSDIESAITKRVLSRISMMAIAR
jgi:tRNA threonylcarbamoyladenosine modification (KEOPS) complex Cgi121 subunit